MPRKKILFVITKSNWGGAQRYVYDLATNLPREFEPVVACGGGGMLVERLRAKGIRMLEVPGFQRDISLLKEIRAFFFLWKLFRKEKPDVVHLNSSKATALGAPAARLAGVPKILFTVHGWPFKEDRSVTARSLIYFISWFTALLSTATIVVSKGDERIGKMMTFIGKKIYYVPIGIDIPDFWTREEASTKLSISTSTPRIVTIAELTANKGIRYAIEAVAELKKRGVGVSYFVIGDGEEREALTLLAQELGVADRVHFLGFIPDASKYLTAFDVFLLPSIKEGMPYVLLEASVAGLPIVATNVVQKEASDIPNIHFVPPSDGRALADAVEKLANSLPDRKPSAVGSFAEMVGKTVALYR